MAYQAALVRTHLYKTSARGKTASVAPAPLKTRVLRNAERAKGLTSKGGNISLICGALVQAGRALGKHLWPHNVKQAVRTSHAHKVPQSTLLRHLGVLMMCTAICTVAAQQGEDVVQEDLMHKGVGVDDDLGGGSVLLDLVNWEPAHLANRLLQPAQHCSHLKRAHTTATAEHMRLCISADNMINGRQGPRAQQQHTSAGTTAGMPTPPSMASSDQTATCCRAASPIGQRCGAAPQLARGGEAAVLPAGGRPAGLAATKEARTRERCSTTSGTHGTSNWRLGS
jgi:hypothetical protein